MYPRIGMDMFSTDREIGTTENEAGNKYRTIDILKQKGIVVL